jgi:hypothetical protein
MTKKERESQRYVMHTALLAIWYAILGMEIFKVYLHGAKQFWRIPVETYHLRKYGLFIHVPFRTCVEIPDRQEITIFQFLTNSQMPDCWAIHQSHTLRRTQTSVSWRTNDAEPRLTF